MNRFILAVIIMTFAHFGYSQLPGNLNLIPNSSFELNSDIDIHDTSFSMSKTCWIKANKSPAVINSHLVKVTTDPRLPFANSDSSALLIVSISGWYKISTLAVFDSSLDIRNYAQTALLKPLVAGATYYLSFYVGQTKMSGKFGFTDFGVNIPNIGVYFSKDKISDYTNIGRINLKPQLNFKSWTISKFDTFEYVKLTAPYTATGDEKYLTIGNFDYFRDFFLYNYDKGFILGPDTLQGIAYPTYIDDLSLVSDTTVPIISLVRFSLGKDTSLACLGDSIKLGGENHFFHYWWNTSDTSRFITIKTPGTYWCRVDFGCSTYTDTIVVKPLDFSFSLGKDTSIDCTGSTMRLKAPDGYAYVWSTGATTAYLDITSPGKYWCRLDYGCGTFTDTILVKANPFTFSLGKDTSLYCFNDSLKLTAPLADTYLWSTFESSAEITVRMPGTYWCRVFDGCNYSFDTIIILPVTVSFTLGDDKVICSNAPITIIVPDGKSILWNTGASTNTIEITTPGTYWCRIDFGCNTVTDTIVVSGSVAPPSFNIADTALCEASLPISISGPYTAAAYLWSNGSSDFTTSFNSIGRQWLRISNTCGDKHYTDTFEIKSLNIALNNINLGNDTSNCLYGFFLDTITLQVPANNSTQIKWSTGSTNNLIKVHEPGAYWVQVSNVCYSVADTINITGCAARDVPKVDIPNAFSPNGDGKNDVFRLKYLPQQVVSFHLKIYNRYGQMVSELKSRNDEWDGGNYELGVYYYLFVYKDITGKEYTQKGDISLVR